VFFSSCEQVKRIRHAAAESKVAREWTHPLYRYPASMSPHIARVIIAEFSAPGDTVLDPFCGGGTTAVEAVTQGRRAICSDLNTLACFVTESKALLVGERQLRLVRDWVSSIHDQLQVRADICPTPVVTTDGGRYVPRTHGLLFAIGDSATGITDQKARRLARLITLRTGQVCFDCRQKPLSPSTLLKVFRSVANEAISKMSAYSMQAKKSDVFLQGRRALRVLNADASNLPIMARSQLREVSLVLTSPPYPGVHVLYHRWQFRGRKELGLPYQLLGLRDGEYESHYTLGPRHERDNRTYFTRLCQIFSGLNRCLVARTPIVQVVAFSRPQSQLRKYADEMRKAGLIELDIGGRNGILSRVVPNRKWYVRTAGTAPDRREYILIHETSGERCG
jgi:hypothetical protein